MELRVLEYFLTVVREENISRAAEVLHVTQPTLSRQMKELEDELHTTLFIRGKRLTLTDSGVMLRRRAVEVVSLMNKVDSEFREQEEISGVISVGSGGLKAAEILPELIGHFRKTGKRERALENVDAALALPEGALTQAGPEVPVIDAARANAGRT